MDEFSKDEQVVIDQFFILKENEEFATAALILYPLMRKNPGNAKILFLLGSTLYSDQQYNKAEQYLNQVIILWPKHSLSSICLFHTLTSLNKWHSAFNEIDRFLSIATKDRNEHIQLLIEMSEAQKSFSKTHRKKLECLYDKYVN